METQPPPPLTSNPDEQHLQLLAIFHYVVAGVGALFACFPLIHVGIGIMMVITWMAWQGKFDAEYYTPVEMSGLYWHFVDIVWIYLFPLLYLIDRS